MSSWTTRRLVAVGLIAVGVAAWLAIDSVHDSSTTSEPVARVVPAARDSADERTDELGRAEAAGEDASSRERIPTLAEAPLSDTPREAGASLRIYGFVLPPAGWTALKREPVVTLTDRLGESRRWKGGLDGAYSFAGLSAGKYWITAASQGDGRVRAVVELEASIPEKRLDLHLELEPEVLVKVVDGTGEALVLGRNVLIAVATIDPPGDWFDEIRGSVNNPFGVGRFAQNGFASEKLPDVYLGRVRLDIEPPVYVSLLFYQRVIATKKVELGQTEVEFVLDRDSPLMQPGSVSFHLLDAETHALVQDAWVELRGCSGARPVENEQGRFHTERISPGWYEIAVRKKGYERLGYRLRIEPGVESDLGDILLGREVWIAGRIVDQAGAAIGVELQIDPYDLERRMALRQEGIEVAVSDDEGRFRVGNLSRGSYLLSILDPELPWARAARLVDTTSGPIDDVQIVLVRGVPLVLSPSDEHWYAVRFTIFDASGLPVVGSRLGSPEPRKILLAPGDYELETWMIGAADSVRRIPITLGSKPVELTLP